MAYMNLFIRERADLRDTADECKRDVAIADEWVQKALAIKKAKAERRSVYGAISDRPPPPPPGAQSAVPQRIQISDNVMPVSYTHLRAHETRHDLVCRLLLE